MIVKVSIPVLLTMLILPISSLAESKPAKTGVKAETKVAVAQAASTPGSQTGSQPAMKGETKPGQNAGAQVGEKAPEGFMLIEEDIAYMLPENYPDQHMESARKHLNKKDLKAAARETRKVQSYLKAQQSRAEGQADSALSTSIQALEQLAASLDSGTPVMESDLKDVFGRAHLALARNDQSHAGMHWNRNQTVKAGEELKAGANHLQKASDWIGNKLEKGSKSAIKETAKASGKIIKGEIIAPEEAQKNIQSLGSEIDKLTNKLEASKPKAEGSASR